MIKQIKFVSIPVADQDRALDFYTEKLGFTIITDQPFDEKQRWIELRVPKAETRVVLFTTDEDKGRVGSFMNMSYTCDDLQKTYEDLKKRGVEFENPPKKEHWGNFAIFKDSEGNRSAAAIGSTWLDCHGGLPPGACAAQLGIIPFATPQSDRRGWRGAPAEDRRKVR